MATLTLDKLWSISVQMILSFYPELRDRLWLIDFLLQACLWLICFRLCWWAATTRSSPGARTPCGQACLPEGNTTPSTEPLFPPPWWIQKIICLNKTKNHLTSSNIPRLLSFFPPSFCLTFSLENCGPSLTTINVYQGFLLRSFKLKFVWTKITFIFIWIASLSWFDWFPPNFRDL